MKPDILLQSVVRSSIFDHHNVIVYEGRLYEEMVQLRGMIRYKYRQILSSDDYDYVQNPALRKRLDRAFARLRKSS